MPIVLNSFSVTEVSNSIIQLSEKVAFWISLLVSDEKIYDLPLDLIAENIRKGLLNVRSRIFERFITPCTLWIFLMGLAETAMT